eukprot:2897030-Heterocapsa_arctica.AAC.1
MAEEEAEELDVADRLESASWRAAGRHAFQAALPALPLHGPPVPCYDGPRDAAPAPPAAGPTEEPPPARAQAI